MYSIVIKKEALKELKIFPNAVVARITTAIQSLSEDPRPTGCLKLKGSKESLWRIRVGDYRIVYHIDDEIRIVSIRNIGDRKNVYE
jgi:mRNA interferase RelE/StbE